jgi:hypothetical protein
MTSSAKSLAWSGLSASCASWKSAYCITKGFLKNVGPFSEFEGCSVVKDPRNSSWIFHKHMKHFTNTKHLGDILVKSEDASEVVDAETHSLYISDVGNMLLYLVKFSKPGISDVVRDGQPTKVHMTSFYRLIKFVVYTTNYGLVMEPT